MLGESYRRRLRSLLLYLCYGFWALIKSPVCWFCTGALGLYFRFVAVPWISEDRPLWESLFQSKVWRNKQHNVIQMMTSFERCPVWPLASLVPCEHTKNNNTRRRFFFGLHLLLHGLCSRLFIRYGSWPKLRTWRRQSWFGSCVLLAVFTLCTRAVSTTCVSRK